jgi:hypothetical protein
MSMYYHPNLTTKVVPAAILWSIFRKCLIQISVGMPIILTREFCIIMKSLPPNAGIVFQIRPWLFPSIVLQIRSCLFPSIVLKSRPWLSPSIVLRKLCRSCLFPALLVPVYYSPWFQSFDAIQQETLQAMLNKSQTHIWLPWETDGKQVKLH